MVLHAIPEPDELVIPVPAESVTLLVGDGSELVSLLCGQLVQKGHQVKVIDLPGFTGSLSLPSSVTSLSLSEISDESIRQVLAQIGKPVSQFIYLYPDLKQKPGFKKSSGKDLLKAVFFFAKYLKNGLSEQAVYTRTSFITVTMGEGNFGTDRIGDDDVLPGGLFGLVKSLNLEWPSVFCRGIDISRDLPADIAAEKISRESTDADIRLVQSAWNTKGRYTLEAVPFIPTEKNNTARISKKSVFLVSGGARGITASCVKALSACFQSTFILLGRTALSAEEPVWARQISDLNTLKQKAIEAVRATGEKPLPRQIDRLVGDVIGQREIKETLAYLKDQGSEVYYRAADVTDIAALKDVLGKLITIVGPVTGLIHGAGRLADKRIEHKTDADFDAVFNVKIDGLDALMQIISPQHLQHIVLFSSVAGFYGNAGQTDYAMANEVLNRQAHWYRRKYPSAHVTAINWGAWDLGMVSTGLKKLLEQHHVSLVPSEEGPRAFIDQLSISFENQTQVILGGTLPTAHAPVDGPLQTYLLHRKLDVEKNPFLDHHVIRGNKVLPISMASVWLAQSAMNLYPGYYLHVAVGIKLFKGLVFDGNHPDLFQIKIQETEKNEERIEVQVTISSEQKGRTVRHYQGNIKLVKTRPIAPVLALPDTALIPLVPDGSVLYRDGTLFHGQDFQGINQVISVHADGVLLRCEHAGVSPDRQGQFPVSGVNGFLADVMYQGMLIWVRHFKDCLCLPLSNEQVTLYEELAFGRAFYVSLKVLKTTDFVMEADLTAFDCETGSVYMDTRRASVTLMKDLQW